MTRLRIAGFSCLMMAALLIVGCALNSVPPQMGTVVADPAALAAELAQASTPRTDEQITFDWSLDEGGSRVRGRGVVRVNAPRRIRLDLFGARGETYLSAALVNDQYRFPSATPPAVALPSPSFLWAALGVFSPAENVTVLAATSDSTTADLRYESPAGELYIFSFDGIDSELPRLTTVERAGTRGVIETVAIDHGPDGRVTATRYRNNEEYRELIFEVTEIRPAGPFSSDIWSPAP